MYYAIAGLITRQILRVARASASRLEGQGMVEYALLLMLIGTMGIVVLVVMGNQVHNVFNNVSCMLSALGGSCAPAVPQQLPPPHD